MSVLYKTLCCWTWPLCGFLFEWRFSGFRDATLRGRLQKMCANLRAMTLLNGKVQPPLKLCQVVKNWMFMLFMIPSGILLQFAIEHGPVEIVDICGFTLILPIDSMVDLSSSLCDSLPEGNDLYIHIYIILDIFWQISTTSPLISVTPSHGQGAETGNCHRSHPNPHRDPHEPRLGEQSAKDAKAG